MQNSAVAEQSQFNPPPKRVIGKPFKPGNPGRPKGVRHKLTIAAERAIHSTFNDLQAIKGKSLTEWAAENTTAFYTVLYPKIIPKNLNVGLNADAIPALVADILVAIAARYERQESLEVEFKDIANTQDAEVCEGE